jgi:hypothetical protein
MHREIVNRDKVEWERASCRGLDTDLFFTARSELVIEGLTYNIIRRMCFDCPIQVDCLKVGTGYEAYGIWGGLAEDERRHIYANTLNTKIIDWLRRDLKELKIEVLPLVQIIQSVEKVFTSWK